MKASGTGGVGGSKGPGRADKGKGPAEDSGVAHGRSAGSRSDKGSSIGPEVGAEVGAEALRKRGAEVPSFDLGAFLQQAKGNPAFLSISYDLVKSGIINIRDLQSLAVASTGTKEFADELLGMVRDTWIDVHQTILSTNFNECTPERLESIWRLYEYMSRSVKVPRGEGGEGTVAKGALSPKKAYAEFLEQLNLWTNTPERLESILRLYEYTIRSVKVPRGEGGEGTVAKGALSPKQAFAEFLEQLNLWVNHDTGEIRYQVGEQEHVIPGRGAAGEGDPFGSLRIYLELADIERRMGDDDWAVRQEAQRTLGPLLNRTKTSNNLTSEQLRVVWGLMEQGVGDGDSRVRWAGQKVLGALLEQPNLTSEQLEVAWGLVEQGVGDDDIDMKRASQEALRVFLKRADVTEKPPGIVLGLVEQGVGDDEGMVRQAAQRALGPLLERPDLTSEQLGIVLKLVEQGVGDADLSVRWAVQLALPALLEHPNVTSEQLGIVLRLVEQGVGDGNEYVRREAQRTLGALREQPNSTSEPERSIEELRHPQPVTDVPVVEQIIVATNPEEVREVVDATRRRYPAVFGFGMRTFAAVAVLFMAIGALVLRRRE